MVDKTQFGELVDVNETVSIASGQQTSDAVDTRGMVLVGVRMPAAFTGTALTFVSGESFAGTYQDVYNSAGTALSATVAASRTVIFNPTDLAGLQFIKLKSGSAEGADRTITLILRAL